MTTTGTEHVAAAIVGRMVDDDNGRRLLTTALRLLADGKPITIAKLAAAAGIPNPDLAVAPAGSDIEYDDEGRIVGWGLTANPTPHRFTVNGHQLYTYCGPDTLIFPFLIGRPAHVVSTDPSTGAEIRFTVDPATGVTDLDPATAVVTQVDPEQFDPQHVRATLCDPQRFFVNADAARDWLVTRPGLTVMPIAEAFQLAKAIAAALETPISPDTQCC